MSSVGSTTWYVGSTNDDTWDMPSGASAECNVHSIPGKTTWFVESTNDDTWDTPSGASAECNVHSIPEKDVKTLHNIAIKLLSWPELNPAQPLSSYETTQREYSIASFIETYQNELPQLAMIKKGYLGDTDSNSLDTGQVLRIHGVHSERRVLAKVTKDSRNCFGFGEMMLSIPVAFPIPMCFENGSGSSKTAKPLKKIIKKHSLPVTVQLMDTTGHDIKLSGKMVLLRGDVKLRLLKEYEGKYIYGNLVKTGEIYRNVISVPSCEPNIRLSVITGPASHNNDHWQSILGLMDHTVTKYIKFDGKLCNTDICDCSSPDFKIEKVLDETFTEPDNKHSSDPDFKIEKVLNKKFTEPHNKHSSNPDFKIEKVLDETFAEPDNKHSSDPDFKIEKVLDETITEPENKHSSDPDFKIEKVMDKTFTEPDNKHSSHPDFKIDMVLDETFTEADNKHSSDPDFKIEKVLDETFTEPDNKYSSDPDFKIEKVLDETFAEADNKHSSGSDFKIEKVLDETFTEPDNKHSSDPDFKFEKVLDETFTEPADRSCNPDDIR